MIVVVLVRIILLLSLIQSCWKRKKKDFFLVLKTYYSNKYFDGKHLPCTLLCTQHGSDIWVLRWVSGSFREFWNFTEKCHLISKFQLRTKISEPWSVSQKGFLNIFSFFNKADFKMFFSEIRSPSPDNF